MSVRTPNLKNGAKLIRHYLAEQSITITHAQALEALSRANGYKDYQCAKVALDAALPHPVARAAAPGPHPQEDDLPNIVLTNQVPDYMVSADFCLGTPEKALLSLEKVLQSGTIDDAWGRRGQLPLRAIMPALEQNKTITMSRLDHILDLDFFEKTYMTGYDYQAMAGHWPANLRDLRYYLEEYLPGYSVEKLIEARAEPKTQPGEGPRRNKQDPSSVEQHRYRTQVIRHAALQLYRQQTAE